MKILKKIGIVLLLIILFMACTCEPVDPKSDLTPYMSDVSYIPQKVYAKGKPQKTKKKSLLAYDYIGKFDLTAYCGCFKCSNGTGITASGTKVKEGRTIAVDTRIIPFGTEVKIGKEIYVAEDTGSAIKGHKIDIYFESHEEAEKFGIKKNVKVYRRRKLGEVLGFANSSNIGKANNVFIVQRFAKSK